MTLYVVIVSSYTTFLLGQTLPLSKSFASRQNNFQIIPLLDTSKAVVVCIFSSILNCNKANKKNSLIQGVKYKSGDLLKAFFICHQKSNKKSRQALRKISFSPQCKFVAATSILYLKSNALIFRCPIFFKEYLNPYGRINKMVNKHSVDWHPIPSGLVSRIYPVIFI